MREVMPCWSCLLTLFTVQWAQAVYLRTCCSNLAGRSEHLDRRAPAYSVEVEGDNEQWHSLAPPNPENSHSPQRVSMSPQPSLYSLSLVCFGESNLG